MKSIIAKAFGSSVSSLVRTLTDGTIMKYASFLLTIFHENSPRYAPIQYNYITIR